MGGKRKFGGFSSLSHHLQIPPGFWGMHLVRLLDYTWYLGFCISNLRAYFGIWGWYLVPRWWEKPCRLVEGNIKMFDNTLALSRVFFLVYLVLRSMYFISGSVHLVFRFVYLVFQIICLVFGCVETPKSEDIARRQSSTNSHKLKRRPLFQSLPSAYLHVAI